MEVNHVGELRPNGQQSPLGRHVYPEAAPIAAMLLLGEEEDGFPGLLVNAAPQTTATTVYHDALM